MQGILLLPSYYVRRIHVAFPLSDLIPPFPELAQASEPHETMLGEAGQFPHMGALLLTALFIVYLCRQWTTRQKILRLGGYAPRIPSYVPLGIDHQPPSGNRLTDRCHSFPSRPGYLIHSNTQRPQKQKP